MRWIGALVWVALATAGIGVPTHAQVPDRDCWVVHLRDADGERHTRFLKRLAHARGLRDVSAFEALLAGRRAELLPRQDEVAAVAEQNGGEVLERLWLVDAILVRGSSPALHGALSRHPLVERLEQEVFVEPGMQQCLDANHHDAVGVHSMLVAGVPLQGGDLTIAVVDSGIDLDSGGTGRPHAAFFPGGSPASPTGPGLQGSRILSAEDMESADGSLVPEDLYGHGTRMASIAAGAKFNQAPDVADGMAPGASIRSYKISDDSLLPFAWGSTLTMAAAFDALAAQPDVLVANISYGGSPNPGSALEKAIDNAVLAGVYVSVLGGNQGASLSSAHGAFNAIASGGTPDLVKAPASIAGLFTSAIGPLPDGRRYPHLLATGEKVTCAALDFEGGSIDSCCTSAASALIAGGALLVRQAAPGLGPLETKALLLDSALEVTLGNPNAAGWGYLHAKRAVDAALAGKVVLESIDGVQLKQFDVALTAGQPAVLTLAWNREPFSGTISNLDLLVRDPAGQVVASSTSFLDNVEQVRWTPASSGVHRVEVLAPSVVGPSTEFALAGVTAHSVDDGFGCPGGPPSIASVVPGQVPAFPGGQVTLSGCGFVGVHTVTYGGAVLQDFQVLSNTSLQVKLYPQPALGTHPLVVTNVLGSASVPLDTVVPPPTIALGAPILVSGANFQVTVAGTPGALMVLCYAAVDQPTSIPGLVSLGIGGGSIAGVLILDTSVVPPPSHHVLTFGPVPAGLQFQVPIFFQGVEVDPQGPVLPFPVSNVAKVIYLF